MRPLDPLPRLVAFDLDDTLLDHSAAERAALGDVHRLFGEHIGHHALDHVHRTYSGHNVPLWREFGAEQITSADLKRLRSERTLEALGAAGLDAVAFSDAYLDRYAAHWRWAEGALAAYRAVAARYPVGVLTNGFTEQQRAKLARLPEVEEIAAFAVVSEEVGVMKPDPALFAHVLDVARQSTGLDLAPADVLYVGDSLHSDVEGGLGAGWRVAWIRGDAARAPYGAVVFETWADLLALLDVA